MQSIGLLGISGLLLVCAVSASLAQPARPSVEGPGFEDSVSVRLIEVDATVYDGKRRRVTGLRAEDFVGFIDGDSVEIVDVEELAYRDLIEVEERRGKARRQSVSSATQPAERPLVAILVDDEMLTTGVSRLVRKTLSEMLAQPGAGTIDWLLMRWSSGLEVEPLNSLSPAEIAERIQIAEKQPARLVRLPRLRQLTIQEIASDYQTLAAVRGTGPRRGQARSEALAAAQGEGACESWTMFAQTAQAYGAEAEVASLRRLEALEAAIEVVSTHSRPATLLALTDQIHVRPGIDALDYVAQLCPTRQRDIEPLMLERNLTPQIQRVAALANAHRVTLVPIDASGLRPALVNDVAFESVVVAPSTRNFQIYNVNTQGALTELAMQTGARPVLNANDVTTAAARALNRAQPSYRITLRAPATLRDGKRHRIGVQLQKIGDYRVESRRSWFDRTLEQQLADAARQYALYERSSGLTLDPTLDFDSSLELRREEDTGDLVVTVRLPRATLDELAVLGGSSGDRLRLWAYAANETYETRARQQFVGLPATGDVVLSFTIPLTRKQMGQGGFWTVSVGMRDESTGATWLENLTTAPAASAEPSTRGMDAREIDT